MKKRGSIQTGNIMNKNNKTYKLVNCAPVLLSQNVKKTVEYYKTNLGFRAEEHFDSSEQFTALYRDETEIIIVKAKFGEVSSNRFKFGAGYDVYLVPESIEGVDNIFEELKAKGVKIDSPPSLKEYGSYEFSIEDIDGRIIGFGQIKESEKFFRK
jgi:predicted lactoylglutathione lyase